AVRLGMLKQGMMVRLLFALQRFAFSQAVLVSSISKRMCDTIEQRGAPTERVVLFPNWVDRQENGQPAEAGVWKRKFAIDQSWSIVSYSGNLGVKQGLDLVIAAAARMRETHPQVLFVIAGNGAEETTLKRTAAEQKVDNVLF